jgi:hypothetical protein
MFNIFLKIGSNKNMGVIPPYIVGDNGYLLIFGIMKPYISKMKIVV